MVGGWGAGKTLTLCRKALLLAAQNPGTRGAIFSPSYRLMKDTTWIQFRQLCDELEIPYKLRKSDFEVHLTWWSHDIAFRSADAPDSMKGPNLSHAQLDEAGQCSLESYEVMASRVREPKAGHRFTGIVGTPEGLGWFRDACEGATAFAELHRVSTAENRSLPERYVRSLTERLSPAKVQAYLEGRFVDLFHGAVYESFERDEHVGVPSTTVPPGPIDHAWDFNVDPACSVIGWHSKGNGGFTVWDEIRIEGGTSTPAHAREFVARFGELGRCHGVRVFGDASGRSRSSQSGTSDWAEIENIYRDAFGEKFLGFYVHRSNPAPIDRFNAANKALRDGRVIIHPRCTGLIDDLALVVYRTGTRDQDGKDRARTHQSDSWSYWVHYLEPIIARDQNYRRLTDLMGDSVRQRNEDL